MTIRPAPFACIDPWPWPQFAAPASPAALRRPQRWTRAEARGEEKGPKEHRPKSNQHGQIINVFKDVQEERTRINFVRLRNL